MWAVVAGAVAARRGQAIIVALVAVLASAALVAAPWYAESARHQVTVDTVTTAPTADRILAVNLRLEDDDPRPDDPAGDARRVFHPPGFASVAGAEATGVLDLRIEPVEADVTSSARVVAREGVCEYIILSGSCPERAGEAVVSYGLADAFALEVGDEIGFGRSGGEMHPLRIVGVYQVVDTSDPYWGTGDVIGLGSGADRHTLFTPPATMPELEQLVYTYQLVTEPEALATTEPDELAALLGDGLAALRAAGYAVTDRSGDRMLEAVASNRSNVMLGVGVGVAVLLLLTWFTLVVVLRGSVTQLRGDVGWWRLHGVPSGRGWLVALGQGIAPLVGGAGLGAAGGLALGRSMLAADFVGEVGTALRLGLALVAVVVTGGLVVVVATQLGTLRTPVRDLLRRVPARGPRWRRSLVDLLVVLVAVAAVGQALVLGREAEGVALLAPGLAVLAIALVAAWALTPLAASLAGRALHGGRLGTALVAASMARRTGTHRLFALIAVAVALVTAGFVGWDTDARDQRQRAALEVGAARVLTVEAPDPARLLAAVRAADPSGTAAMAVVRRGRTGEHPPVLAVDSTRLAVVADWREQEYGGPRNRVAAALRPSAPEAVELTGTSLVVETTATDPSGAEVFLRVRLRVLDTGAPVEAVLGPLNASAPDRPGLAGTHQADVPACADGCRLVGFELLGPEQADGRVRPSPGTTVELHELAVGDTAASLADPARWRPAVGPRDVGPVITGSGDGLLVAVPEDLATEVLVPPGDEVAVRRDFWVYPQDTPVPLPVVAAGWRPGPIDEVRVAPLPGAAVPSTVAGAAQLLPREAGAGVLVDLEYAERLVPFPTGGSTAEVWLSGTAPASIVDDLAEAGVTVLRDESLAAQVARLSSEGSAVGGRFQAAVAVLGLVLVAGAVLVFSAQERAGRAAELAALRAQGVPARTVRVVGYGGLAGVVGAAVLVGLVAGLVAAGLALVLDPGFVDGWRLVPAAAPRALPVAVATGAAVVVLMGAVLVAAAGLVRRIRRGPAQANGGLS